MLGSKAGQYPGKGGSPLPQHRHGSARAWGQGRECLRAEPPFSSSQALSLPSLLVGAVPSANPPLNMVHTRLPPLDPDLPAFPGELLRGERRSGIVASGLTGGQVAQPLLLLCSGQLPHKAKPSPPPVSGKRGLGLPTPILACMEPEAKVFSWPQDPPQRPPAPDRRAQDPRVIRFSPHLLP